MGNFIITGATGFIGSHLAKKLMDENHNVYLICRENSDLSLFNNYNPTVFKYKDNISELIQFMKSSNSDCVFHLSSLFIAEHKTSDISSLINSNLKFATEILEAASCANIKNFINTGTSWEHFENDDYNPVCLYAATKHAFESIIEFYVKAKNINAITIKLFDTYGENDTRNKLINNLKQFSLNGKVLDMSPGDQVIDLTHVEDIVSGFIAAYKYMSQSTKVLHEHFALSSNRVLTLKEVINIFEKETGYKVKINWGTRAYRDREVMIPWSNYILVPNWKSTITLEEGVKKIARK